MRRVPAIGTSEVGQCCQGWKERTPLERDGVSHQNAGLLRLSKVKRTDDVEEQEQGCCLTLSEVRPSEVDTS